MTTHVVGAYGKKERTVYGITIQQGTQLWNAVPGSPETIHVDPEAYLHWTPEKTRLLHLFLVAGS